MRVTQRRDFDDSDENENVHAQEECVPEQASVFVWCIWSPAAVCGCRVRTRATQGHGERLCRELEVDTVGQRRGGWVQGGVIEPLQTSHLEQLNLGL